VNDLLATGQFKQKYSEAETTIRATEETKGYWQIH